MDTNPTEVTLKSGPLVWFGSRCPPKPYIIVDGVFFQWQMNLEYVMSPASMLGVRDLGLRLVAAGSAH